MKLSKNEKGVLLLAARDSILSLFDNARIATIDYKVYPNLEKPMGAFVTLLLKNRLRGCIGYIESDMPLFETVCAAAKLAASEDPRFVPITFDEASSIKIEISVLSTPTPITNYNDIIIGEHGIILDDEEGRGVLLPQVPVEQKWNLNEYLSGICRKAGLAPDTWENRFLHFKVFTADVFFEENHKSLSGEIL